MTTEQVNTPVDSDNIQSDTAADPVGVKTETTASPKVEMRDGKLYIDGNRAYTRDDTNKIAATARQEAERQLLQQLEVDDIKAVKDVIKTIRSTEGNDALNVSALKDAVKRKEQTVEELNNTVKQLKTELVLNKHMTQLHSSMPGSWTEDQKSAVIDLMKARSMIMVEGDTFQIRNGDTFLTQDGERPDYRGAVEIVGRTLGLNFGKNGVAVANGEKIPQESKSDALDEKALQKDPMYRSAYTSVRTSNPMLGRSEITDAMVRQKMEKMSRVGNLAQIGVANSNQNNLPNRRK
jgi:hypothetical protein